jgi:hypothetical protein
MVPSGRCLRPRASCGLPVLVQAVPVRGQAAVRMILPRPRAGSQVIVAQGDGFFRAQRRVVQAAEERGQFRPGTANLGHDHPDVRRAGDGSRADGNGGSGRVPLHLSDRVGGQQPEFDGVAEGAVERAGNVRAGRRPRRSLSDDPNREVRTHQIQ